MSRFSKRYADTVQRLRVPMGFLLAVLFAALATPTLRSVLWGIPIAGFGLWLRGWAAGHLEKNQRLTTTGPYAWTRNPLYLGTLIAVLGLAVAAKRPLLAWISFLVFYFVYLPAVEQEESHLRKLFPEFAAYAERVNMFRPMIPKEDAPQKDFSWPLYWRNQEFKAAVAFLLMIGYLFWRAG
jgi:protein-S-isoprenylcysteine O-methyltransferase Ste14